MDTLINFFQQLHSAEGLVSLIQAGGLIVLITIIFVETGLLVGFFLPGDSLLITAGILSSPHAIGGGLFNPITLIICLTVAAISGDQLNFYLGKRTGRFVINRPDGRLIKKCHFENAHAFYLRKGGMAIVMARFIPILRTFVPFVAGFAAMPYRQFILFNIVGGATWVMGLVGVGYWLGHTQWATKLHQVILIVVVISILPIVIGFLKSQWLKRQTRA
jgi:membrane-associated protein